MAEGAGIDVRALLDGLARRVRERPYPMLALGVAAGYVAGGGTFSRWTRPLARAALAALLVPGFRERLRATAAELGGGAAAPA